ncbi:hypothetical protein [Desulfobotulus sp.]|jgi:hypothetical protein|uniref:hypothetical protein n=1 Tax=Desulfobotulus sp. TaxID=1940337 RepID=UPI002A36BF8D|nr:hypothetical protein [Desulfobotulus sp.]MDY0164766.1 hypothetical protein [Desulfobotulus sp.]
MTDTETNTKDTAPEEGKGYSEKNDVGFVEPEMLKGLPPEARKVLEIGMSMHRLGPVPHPLVDKINETHITRILELAEKDDERSFRDAAENRKYTLIYVLVFAVLFIFATVFLVGSDKELYREVIKLFAVFLGGLGSGFGIRSYMDRNK